MKTRLRQGRVNGLTLLLLAVLAVGGVATWTFGPYWLDYMNMKEIAASSGLAWYAGASESAGRSRLRQGLETKEIDYITEDDCQFSKTRDVITVWCTWEVNAFYPFTSYYKTLSYEITTEVNDRGVVNQY